MRSSLLKPKSLSVDAMSSRIKVLNIYLANFPLPDNKSFSQGEMIEIVLIMLPTVCVDIMFTAGLEPREKTYKELIERLERLESSLPDEAIPRKKDNKDDPEVTNNTNILKKDRLDKRSEV